MTEPAYREAMFSDTPTPTAQELKAKCGEFLSKPNQPRPVADAPAYRFHSPEQLRTAQRQWDNADAENKRIAQWSADRRKEEQAKAEAKRQAHEDAELAKRQDQRVAIVADLKRSFLATPGTLETDWTPEREEQELAASFDRASGRADDAARGTSRRALPNRSTSHGRSARAHADRSPLR